MPEDVQTAAARAILDYDADQHDVLRLSDEQVVEIERRIAEPNPPFLSLDDARDHLRQFGV